MPQFTNGNFETGDYTGWSGVGSVTTAAAHSGSYGCSVTCGPGGWESIYQTIPSLDPTTQISFWYKIVSSDGGSYGFLISMGGGDEGQLLPYSGTCEWRQYVGYSGDWGIPETMDTEIVLTLADGEWNTHVLYVDDFYVEQPEYIYSSLTSRYIIFTNEEYIKNPDFESNGISQWGTTGTVFAIHYYEGQPAHSGTCSAMLYNESSIFQTIPAVSSITLWAKLVNYQGISNRSISVSDQHSNSVSHEVITIDEWIQVVLDTSTFNKNDLFTITASITNNNGYNVYMLVDDFSSIPVAITSSIESSYIVDVTHRSIISSYNIYSFKSIESSYCIKLPSLSISSRYIILSPSCIIHTFEDGILDTDIWDIKQSGGYCGIQSNNSYAGTYSIGSDQVSDGDLSGSYTYDQNHVYIKLVDSSTATHNFTFWYKHWQNSYWGGHFCGFAIPGYELYQAPLIDGRVRDNTYRLYDVTVTRINDSQITIDILESGVEVYSNTLDYTLQTYILFGANTRGNSDNTCAFRFDNVTIGGVITSMLTSSYTLTYVDKSIISSYTLLPHVDRVINGSFETNDLSGWSYEGDVSISPNYAYSGSYSAFLSTHKDAVQASYILQQIVPVSSVSAYICNLSPNSTTIMVISSDLIIEDTVLGENTPQWSYTKVTLDTRTLNRHDSTWTLVVRANYTGAYNYNEVQVDNITTIDLLPWVELSSSYEIRIHKSITSLYKITVHKSITSSYNILASKSITSKYEIYKLGNKYITSYYNILAIKSITSSYNTIVGKNIISSYNVVCGLSIESRYNLFVNKILLSKYIITKHITNGDFELGNLTGWFTAGTQQNAIFAQNNNQHSGSWCGSLAVTNTDSWCSIRQYITPVKSVSCWVKSFATNSYIEIIDNNGNTGFVSSFTQDSSYHQYTINTYLLNRNDMWLISVMVSKTPSSDALYVDDFTYEELPPYKTLISDYNILGGKSIVTYFNVNRLSIPVIINVVYPNISDMGVNTWITI